VDNANEQQTATAAKPVGHQATDSSATVQRKPTGSTDTTTTQQSSDNPQPATHQKQLPATNQSALNTVASVPHQTTHNTTDSAPPATNNDSCNESLIQSTNKFPVMEQ